MKWVKRKHDEVGVDRVPSFDLNRKAPQCKRRLLAENKCEDLAASPPSISTKESKAVHCQLARVNKKSTRPTPDECYFVVQALSKIHPDVMAENNRRRAAFIRRTDGNSVPQSEPSKPKRKQPLQYETPVTDAIISTMLSQNTTEANQKRAFSKLKESFPGGWRQVAETTDVSVIEAAIRIAGLAKTRAKRIQAMLKKIQEERGEANFEYLARLTDDQDVKRELSRFPGMGPKTISCVLLFALGRPDFPVDTHVLRISQQMGWLDNDSSREAAYDYLNRLVPDDCKLDLHCLLVKHGKHCPNCAANGHPQFPPRNKSTWICPLSGIKKGDK